VVLLKVIHKIATVLRFEGFIGTSSGICQLHGGFPGILTLSIERRNAETAAILGLLGLPE
jgi:hypothetical protein